MSLYLGIDIGTQSVKVLLYDADTKCIVATASSALEITSADDGTREQLAQWWLQGLKQCLGEISPILKQQVLAIAVSGQQHGFVALAADGTVLAPVKLWCDTATTAECEQIMSAFGGRQRCLEEVGNPILPGYTASKIRWLKNHKPDAYAGLATILLPHDYINYTLTGELAMECGDASGTGLLDIRSRSWHPGIVAALDSERDLSNCLPPLVAADACIGRLLPDIAQELGLPVSIPVAAGGGDNMMAAIGTGNVMAGRVTASLGTSGTMFAYSDDAVIDDGGDLAAFCSSTGGWLPLLCTMNCTVATEMARDFLKLDMTELESLAGAAAIGSGGVFTLPFYNGERSPDLPHGKACIMGLDTSNSNRANILRSAMEGASFGLRAGLDAFSRHACDLDEVCLTGGGSRNAIWRQMLADIFARPVRVLEQDEGAAMGAALQALWMHRRQGGEAITIADLVEQNLRFDDSRSCIPDGEASQHYQQVYQHYLQHVELVTPLYSQVMV